MTSQIDAIYKGNVTTAHNAITATATSGYIDCRGYNALMITVTVGAGGGTWKIDLMGCNTIAGTYVDIYDSLGNRLTTGNLTASRMTLFTGIPDYVKIEATEVVNGSACTVAAQPVII